MGVSPFVGGLLGSSTCFGRPNEEKKWSRGKLISRGENNPSVGVGGDSTSCIPTKFVKGSCSARCMGLLVMVSTLGDIRAASLGKLRMTLTRLSPEFLSSSVEKPPTWSVNGVAPSRPGAGPNRWVANPGEGGGFGSDMTELEETNPESGGVGGGGTGSRTLSRLNRPYFWGSLSSSCSPHEKLDGADDGPGEMASLLLGVEFPRARNGLRSWSVFMAPVSSVGNGAVRGSLGAISMASAESVIRCFVVGLLPDLTVLNPELGVNFLLDTSFWKSWRQYISRMLGLIHLLFACAA